MKITKRLYLASLALAFSSNALAWTTDTSDNVWRSGWGMGVSEAEVTSGSGNTIYVACTDPENFGGSSISISLVGDTTKNGKFFAQFDGGKLEEFQTNSDGYVVSNNRAAAATFTYLLEKFKKHQKVYIRFPNGHVATFTLRGAKKALGNEENCKAAFYY